MKHSVKITFEGLSLFVPRPEHIDVLFPAFGEGNARHLVSIFSGKAKARYNNRALDGTVLDLRGLPVLERTPHPIVTAGLLQLPVALLAPVKMEATLENPTYCVAAMRLPYGVVMSEELEGPFEYNGNENMWVARKLSWLAAISAPPGAEITGLLRNQGSLDSGTTTVTLCQDDGAPGSYELTVLCMSDNDQASHEPMEAGDQVEDYEAYGKLVSAPHSVPVLPRAPVFGLKRKTVPPPPVPGVPPIALPAPGAPPIASAVLGAPPGTNPGTGSPPTTLPMPGSPRLCPHAMVGMQA